MNKLLINKLFLLLVFLSSIFTLTAETWRQRLKFDMPIRVLIDEQKEPRAVSWQLDFDKGFVVILKTPHHKPELFDEQVAKIKATAKKIYINSRAYTQDWVMLMPRAGLTHRGEHSYEGAFVIARTDQGVFLVNHLDLEDYLPAVISYESWPGWSDEVNKAFCIGFRSYGAAKMLEQRQKSMKTGVFLPYDIKSTTSHQVYKGHKRAAKFKKISQETKGIVLACNNKPILAMFDICCGSIVPARKSGIDFNKAPYLARNYPCTYCKNYKLHTWELAFTLKELQDIFKQEFPKLGLLKDIKISRKDEAGIVQEIKLHGSSQWFVLTGNKTKALIKKLKSLYFTIVKRGKNIIFKGRGFGHLVGLCQRGAHGMASENWNHRDILQFFYPGTKFMQLKKAQLN